MSPTVVSYTQACDATIYGWSPSSRVQPAPLSTEMHFETSLYEPTPVAMAQRRQMVSSDYDPMRIGTPGYSEQLARGRPWDPPGDYSDDRPWLRQETSGDYDPFNIG